MTRGFRSKPPPAPDSPNLNLSNLQPYIDRALLHPHAAFPAAVKAAKQQPDPEASRRRLSVLAAFTAALSLACLTAPGWVASRLIAGPAAVVAAAEVGGREMLAAEVAAAQAAVPLAVGGTQGLLVRAMGAAMLPLVATSAVLKARAWVPE